VTAENGAAKFPERSLPVELQAVLTLTASVGIAARSWSVRLRHWMLRQTAPMKEAMATRELLTSTELEKALERLRTGELSEDSAKCALDQMILRETAAADKEGRQPDYHSREIYDEVCATPYPDRALFTYLWAAVWLSKRRRRQHYFSYAMGCEVPWTIPRRPTVPTGSSLGSVL
jgi:hypothetical protein